MRLTIIAGLACAAALAAGSAQARSTYPQPVRALMLQEARLDRQCRGTPGADPMGPVCKRRDALTQRLERMGWCWGPDAAAAEYQRHWMRQGAGCKASFGG